MIELSLEQRREFLRHYAKLVEMFGQELVDAGLMRYTLDQLCDIHHIPLQNTYKHPAANVPNAPWQKPYIFLGRKLAHYRFVNSAGWEKTVPTPVTEWLVPAAFQNNYQAAHILRPALLALRPWLTMFRLEIYNRNFSQNHDEDFYVKLGYGYWKNGSFDSLYVPMRAFMRGDVEAIIKRNQDYFKWYTKTNSVWDTMKLDPTVITFLNMTKENAK